LALLIILLSVVGSVFGRLVPWRFSKNKGSSLFDADLED
jgi:hypothetical protein